MRIVALLSRFPFPLEKGDKLRAYHLLQELAANHEIHLFALSDKPPSDIQLQAVAWATSVEVVILTKVQIIQALVANIPGKLPFQVAYFYHSSVKKRLAAYMSRIQPQHIYCQLLRMAPYVKDYPDIPATLDYMDAFAAGMQRRMTQSRGLERLATSIEYARLRLYEEQAFNWFQYHTIITQQDQQLIHHAQAGTISIIGNGIDTDYFQPTDNKKDIDIIFCGNMSYPPNVRAARRLVNAIRPRLLRHFPDLKIAIVGTDPSTEVQALANEKVIVTGWVDDIREWYNRAKVMVAPMEIGAGLQNKLLEAMAMEIPCVTTSLAAKAMHAELQALLHVADNDDNLAQLCHSLLVNQQIRLQNGKEARELVTKHYHWSSMAGRLASLWANG